MCQCANRTPLGEGARRWNNHGLRRLVMGPSRELIDILLARANAPAAPAWSGDDRGGVRSTVRGASRSAPAGRGTPSSPRGLRN